MSNSMILLDPSDGGQKRFNKEKFSECLTHFLAENPIVKGKKMTKNRLSQEVADDLNIQLDTAKNWFYLKCCPNDIVCVQAIAKAIAVPYLVLLTPAHEKETEPMQSQASSLKTNAQNADFPVLSDTDLSLIEIVYSRCIEAILSLKKAQDLESIQNNVLMEICSDAQNTYLSNLKEIDKLIHSHSLSVSSNTINRLLRIVLELKFFQGYRIPGRWVELNTLSSLWTGSLWLYYYFVCLERERLLQLVGYCYIQDECEIAKNMNLPYVELPEDTYEYIDGRALRSLDNTLADATELQKYGFHGDDYGELELAPWDIYAYIVSTTIRELFESDLLSDVESNISMIPSDSCSFHRITENDFPESISALFSSVLKTNTK